MNGERAKQLEEQLDKTNNIILANYMVDASEPDAPQFAKSPLAMPVYLRGFIAGYFLCDAFVKAGTPREKRDKIVESHYDNARDHIAALAKKMGMEVK